MNNEQFHIVGIFIGILTLAAVVMLSDGKWTANESMFVAGATTSAAVLLLLMKGKN